MSRVVAIGGRFVAQCYFEIDGHDGLVQTSAVTLVLVDKLRCKDRASAQGTTKVYPGTAPYAGGKVM